MRTVEEIAADPQPGDVYEGSWGYDQTNAEFWQVIKRTPATVTVRKLALKMDGRRVVPMTVETGGLRFVTEGRWIKDADGNSVYDSTTIYYVEKLCRLGRKAWNTDAPGARLKMESYYSLHPWDGQPAYDTIMAGEPGH